MALTVIHLWPRIPFPEQNETFHFQTREEMGIQFPGIWETGDSISGQMDSCDFQWN